VFDFSHHGQIDAHRYRGYYDAQLGSTTQCAYCGRIIRYCYAIHNQHGKTFVIGLIVVVLYYGLLITAFWYMFPITPKAA